MPNVQCACPGCRLPLMIAQALPVQVRCPRCGMTFLLQPPPGIAPGAPPRQAVAPAPHLPVPTAPRPAPAPSGGNAGIFAVLGVLVLALVVGLVWVIWPRGEASTSEQTRDPFAQVAPPPPPLTPRQKQIKASVDRGVAYLQREVAAGGLLYPGNSRGGAHTGAFALGGLTLLECGVPPTDPAVQKAAAHVRQEAPRLTFTYGVALAILFLDRLDRANGAQTGGGHADLIRAMALRLIAGQSANGGWGYHCRPLNAEQQGELLTMLKSERFTPGAFRMPGPVNTWYDHSIGQFVTLALWTARKHGVPIRPTLRAVAETYRAKQRADGAWAYRADRNHFLETGTCAGLIGLAVGHAIEDEEGGDRDPKAPRLNADLSKDPAVRKGLEHLAKIVGKKADLPEELRAQRHKHTADMDNLTRALQTANAEERKKLVQDLRVLDRADLEHGTVFDADAWGDLYFLWSLERMAVIYDLKLIEGKDWHEWGTDILLAFQKEDGSWRDRFPGVCDTCFALLFLKRINIAKDLTDKLRALRQPGVAAGRGQPPAPPQGRKE